MTATVKVLSIMGSTRSGTTVLDNILGELAGCFSSGELHYLWARGLIEGRRCGCGQPVSECPVWSEVLRLAFGDQCPLPEAVVDWQRREIRTRHTRRLLANGVDRAQGGALSNYLNVLECLYAGIAEVTGAEVIVDSSKGSADSAILELLPNVESYSIHLVRDPRGVAHSWARHKRELDAPKRIEMERHSAIRSAKHWMQANLGAEAVRRHCGPSRVQFLRYEDFVASPENSIRMILDLIGIRPDRWPFEDPHTVHLGTNHSVSGNPSRFKTGSLSLRPDLAWRDEATLFNKIVTPSLTWPLMKRYGYALSSDYSRSFGA